MTIGRLESHIAAGSTIIGWLVLALGDKQLICLFCPVHRRVYNTMFSIIILLTDEFLRQDIS